MTRALASRKWGLVLAFAAVWATAAAVLWQSGVPGDLRLPDLDAARYFTPDELERARRYERFLRIDFVLSQIVLLVVLALYARRGPRFVRESAAGRIGTGMLLGMLGLAFVWLAQIPFGLAELWWQRRHGLAREGYVEWLLGDWLGLGGAFLFICLALLIVMALAVAFGQRWWIPCAAAFVALGVLFAFVYPYLIPDLHSLRRPAIAADARQLAREQGVEEVEVEVQDVREFTTAPNAEATGIGPSRRVILWDTLLDGRFPRAEVRFVLAHELAHVSRNHIWRAIAWYALFAVPGAYLIAVATRRRGGMADPRAVPYSLLVLVVLSLLAQPVQNVVTRHLEAEADWVALETTREPRAARSLFHRFGTTALVEPSPPTWAYLLLDTHPTLMQRIAMAEAWERRVP